MTSTLANMGARILGDGSPTAPGSPRTCIVLGAGRGGTSAVAGALHHLGVFMGDESRPPLFEDARIFRPLESGDDRALQAVIDDYTRAHTIWGFKRASMPAHLERVHARFTRPLYIAVFRDIAAVANRVELSTGRDYVAALAKQHAHYSKIVHFLRVERPQALVVSYEKLLAHPDAFVSTLCDFCGISPSEDEIARALQFIRPSPEDYVRASSATGTIGEVERPRPDVVRGWARRIQQDQPCIVELLVDGRVVDECLADGRHEDAPKDDLYRRYGFRFERPELAPDDDVRVRLKGDPLDLGEIVDPASQAPKVIGAVNVRARKSIRGWARYEGDERFATVEILVNGEKIGETLADQSRPKLKAVKSTADCAFVFDYPPLKSGDEVFVRVAGARLAIRNSPYRVP